MAPDECGHPLRPLSVRDSGSNVEPGFMWHAIGSGTRLLRVLSAAAQGMRHDPGGDLDQRAVGQPRGLAEMRAWPRQRARLRVTPIRLNDPEIGARTMATGTTILSGAVGTLPRTGLKIISHTASSWTSL